MLPELGKHSLCSMAQSGTTSDLQWVGFVQQKPSKDHWESTEPLLCPATSSSTTFQHPTYLKGSQTHLHYHRSQQQIERCTQAQQRSWRQRGVLPLHPGERQQGLGVLLLQGIKTERENKVLKHISRFPEGWGFEECGGHLQTSDPAALPNGKQLLLLQKAKACGAHPAGPIP